MLLLTNIFRKKWKTTKNQYTPFNFVEAGGIKKLFEGTFKMVLLNDLKVKQHTKPYRCIHFHHIAIIKSEVWPICHCLELGHETKVCAVCLFIFFWMFLLRELLINHVKILHTASNIRNPIRIIIGVIKYSMQIVMQDDNYLIVHYHQLRWLYENLCNATSHCEKPA